MISNFLRIVKHDGAYRRNSGRCENRRNSEPWFRRPFFPLPRIFCSPYMAGDPSDFISRDYLVHLHSLLSTAISAKKNPLDGGVQGAGRTGPEMMISNFLRKVKHDGAYRRNSGRCENRRNSEPWFRRPFFPLPRIFCSPYMAGDPSDFTSRDYLVTLHSLHSACARRTGPGRSLPRQRWMVPGVHSAVRA